MMPGENTQRQGTDKRSRARREAKMDRCPVCSKPVSDEYRPFCSKRCADVDLSRWLGGKYAIPGEPADDGEEFEG